MQLVKLFLLLTPFLVFSACDDDDGVDVFQMNETSIGLATVSVDDGNFDAIYGNVISALNGVDAIGIVAEVDHSANATGAGLSLPPTKLVLFGNPNLGTPIMQTNQRAGLDLPQKMLVYRADDDDVVVAYNSAEYLAARHAVDTVSTLPMIANALRNFAFTASGENELTLNTNRVLVNEGIIDVTSDDDVATVYGRIKNAIDANPNVRVIAELDHQANAARVGMTLRPTRLIVFGNPALGTPMMQARRNAAVDLPQKMLVYENADGQTKIIYNDPAWVARRHRIDEDLPQIATVRGALDNFAAIGANN